MTPVPDASTLSLASLEALRDIRYHAVTTITFVVWDVFLTLEDEADYIWTMRRCIFKWLYFYFRYFLVAVQIFNLAVMPSLSSGRTPDFLCMLWYQYALFLAQLTTFMIDIVMVARIYALFNKSRRVALFLCGLILLEVGFAATHMASFPKTEYFEACLLPLARHDMARVHPTVCFIVQSTIMGLFFFKRFVGARSGWGRAPLVSFLMRDATGNYVIVFLTCAVTFLYCGFDDMRIIVLFYWTISLNSSIGSRLILNMERFAKGNHWEEEVVQFTSHISLY